RPASAPRPLLLFDQDRRRPGGLRLLPHRARRRLPLAFPHPPPPRSRSLSASPGGTLACRRGGHQARRPDLLRSHLALSASWDRSPLNGHSLPQAPIACRVEPECAEKALSKIEV